MSLSYRILGYGHCLDHFGAMSENEIIQNLSKAAGYGTARSQEGTFRGDFTAGQCLSVTIKNMIKLVQKQKSVHTTVSSP